MSQESVAAEGGKRTKKKPDSTVWIESALLVFIWFKCS